ncbi:Chitin synthase, class 3 [Pestalotiopsis sp. IQ-011]
MQTLRFSILGSVLATAAAAQDRVYLNVTALTPIDGESALQCWQLPSPFSPSMPNVNNNNNSSSYGLPLGETANATLFVVPAGSDAGLHHTEAAQWVIFITGLAHVTLPRSSDQAWISGGKYGLLWAGDLAGASGQGHRTFYHEQTVGLILPARHGREPEHSVVRQGACLPQDLLGLATLGEGEGGCVMREDEYGFSRV